MILEALYLKNIRSYKSVDIDLQQGISLFEGDVGSGKSTILMAIEFAFFGLGNQRGESLLRKDEVKGEVVLNFEVEGTDGIIKRTLQRSDLNGRVSQGKGMLFWDGEKMELSPSELKEMILDIIDFKEDVNPRANSHIFRYAVYTPQEEMKEIINQRPDERMQTLRKAFGVEEYKIAAENAGLVLKELKEKQSYLSGKMEKYDSIEEELTEAKVTLETDDQNLGELIEQKVSIEENFENVKEDVEKVKSLKNQQEKLELKRKYNERERARVKSDLKNGIKTLEETENYKEKVVMKRIKQFKDVDTEGAIDGEEIKNKINKVEGIISKKIDIEAKIDILNDQQDTIIKKMGNFADKSSTRLNTEKEKSLAKMRELEEKENKNKKEISDHESEIKYLHSEIRELDEKHTNLDVINDKCPTCNADLSKEKKEEIIEAMEHDIVTFEKKEIECKKAIDKLRSDLTKIKENKTIYREKWEKYTCLEKEALELENKEKILSKLKEEIEGYKLPLIELGTDTNGFSTLKEYLESLREKLDSVKQFEINKKRLADAKYDLKKTERTINETKEGIKEREEELKELDKEWLKLGEKWEKTVHEMDNMGAIGDEFENIESELNNVQEKLTSCKTNIQFKKKRIAQLEHELDDLQEAKEKQIYLEECGLWVRDFFIPSVKTIEKNILSELFVEFNNTFKNWFDILVADETKSARLDIDFTPLVEQGGMAQEINFLSGGEKTSVALAYRLALNKLVKKVSVGMETNLLILDEPTDGLSKEQLLRLREILDQMDCSQIIMVSHEQELEGLADNIIHVEKDNGISRVEETV